jgi:hypothetical protein
VARKFSHKKAWISLTFTLKSAMFIMEVDEGPCLVGCPEVAKFKLARGVASFFLNGLKPFPTYSYIYSIPAIAPSP